MACIDRCDPVLSSRGYRGWGIFTIARGSITLDDRPSCCRSTEQIGGLRVSVMRRSKLVEAVLFRNWGSRCGDMSAFA